MVRKGLFGSWTDLRASDLGNYTFVKLIDERAKSSVILPMEMIRIMFDTALDDPTPMAEIRFRLYSAIPALAAHRR